MSIPSSDLGQIENRKRARHIYKFWWNWGLIAIYLLVSWAVVSMVLGSDMPYEAIEVRDYFILDLTGDMTYFSVNLYAYYPTALLLLFIVHGLFIAPSVSKVRDEIEKRDFSHKKVGITLKAKLKVVSFLDKLFFWMFFLPSTVFISADEGNKLIRERIFIRYGWFSHLEFNFFKRKSKIVDGYDRVSTLDLFKDYPLLFSSEKTVEAAKNSLEFRTARKLFRSAEHMEDVFNISEGYIDNDQKKYDRRLEGEEYKKVLSKKNGKLNNMRLFNGIDEVIFSHSLIKDLLDEENKRYSFYFKKYALSRSGFTFSRAYRKYFKMLLGDKKTLDMIARLPYPEPLDSADQMTEKELVKRIEFLFSVYFRVASCVYVINQYINLPAGTVVVKLDDYSMRMILEIYDIEKIVSITEGKNDGTNKMVNADILANLFLLSWNYYNHSVEDSFKKRVYSIFNFRDEKIEEHLREKQINDNFLKAEDAKKSLDKLEVKPPEKDETDYDEAIERLFSEE